MKKVSETTERVTSQGEYKKRVDYRTREPNNKEDRLPEDIAASRAINLATMSENQLALIWQMKQARAALGFKQETMAEEFKVRVSTYCRWEMGSRKIDESHVEAFRFALKYILNTYAKHKSLETTESKAVKILVQKEKENVRKERDRQRKAYERKKRLEQQGTDTAE